MHLQRLLVESLDRLLIDKLICYTINCLVSIFSKWCYICNMFFSKLDFTEPYSYLFHRRHPWTLLIIITSWDDIASWYSRLIILRDRWIWNNKERFTETEHRMTFFFLLLIAGPIIWDILKTCNIFGVGITRLTSNFKYIFVTDRH